MDPKFRVQIAKSKFKNLTGAAKQTFLSIKHEDFSIGFSQKSSNAILCKENDKQAQLRHKFHYIKKCPSRELPDLLLKGSELLCKQSKQDLISQIFQNNLTSPVKINYEPS